MILRLDGSSTTLLLLQRETTMPEIVHWGTRLPDRLAEPELLAMRDRARPHNWMDDDIAVTTLFPTVGMGLFQAPALAAHRGDADWTASFEVTDIATTSGLLIQARDAAARLGLTISLTLRGDVLCSTTTLRNDGSAPLSVDWLAAGVFLLPPQATELLVMGGRWGHEFDERRIALPTGAHSIENRRGRTSHDRFPLLTAGPSGFSEEHGEVWSLHLGWSGNHRTHAERLPDGSLSIQVGALFEPGEMQLAPGAELTSPTAHAAWSDAGLAGLSRAWHAHVRAHVVQWPGGAMTPRPVTLNTWEGTYFAHDEARLMRQASAAAALGVERFVLDDGWMKGRRDDTAGLGDWVVDAEKYPRGLGPLARHVTECGMQFGLWVEPEMANPDSDAVRNDPGCVLRVAGRPLLSARNQVVVDLTRPAVFGRVHAALDQLLRTLPVSYLKWDMNRDLTAAGGADGEAATRRQTLAAYAMMARLRADHPGLEIESCASGGGRCDLGVLAHCQRVWASDCTDALDRLDIQRGLSRLLPPELIGAHISAAPNHQTGRQHSLAFRAAVALFQHFGIELDPLALTADEATELRSWIELHKSLRPLLHAGLHVASDPVDGRSVRGVVAPDFSAAAWLVAQHASPLLPLAPTLRLPGLPAHARYLLAAPPPQRVPGRRPSATHRALFEGGVTVSGAALATVGFSPPLLGPESALILTATRQ